jgi:hypothetical protein
MPPPGYAQCSGQRLEIFFWADQYCCTVLIIIVSLVAFVATTCSASELANAMKDCLILIQLTAPPNKLNTYALVDVLYCRMRQKCNYLGIHDITSEVF